MELLFAVERPRCIELLVPSVLGVDLSEHEQLDIVRVTGACAGRSLRKHPRGSRSQTCPRRTIPCSGSDLQAIDHVGRDEETLKKLIGGK
jgi:hypothetical protein